MQVTNCTPGLGRSQVGNITIANMCGKISTVKQRSINFYIATTFQDSTSIPGILQYSILLMFIAGMPSANQ